MPILLESFEVFKNRTKYNFYKEMKTSRSVDDCADICRKEGFWCKSISFRKSSKLRDNCLLSTNRVEFIPDADQVDRVRLASLKQDIVFI